VLSLKQLEKRQPPTDKDEDVLNIMSDTKNPVVFKILTRSAGASIKHCDVGYLQSLAENRDAVFQVASNFNGVEAISDNSTPDEDYFCTNYIYDRTQGPVASISAGPAAIARVHAGFFHPDEKDHRVWWQTKDHQINFLDELPNYFTLKNGYVHLEEEEDDEPSQQATIRVGEDFPDPDTEYSRYRELLKKAKIGVHRGVQVTYGHRNGMDLEKVEDNKKEQVIDQVFCAALNISQGQSGYVNRRNKFADVKTRFCLDLAYEGTYLATTELKRKKLFLTLIGGGAFGNSRDVIHDAIIRAHQKYATKKNRFRRGHFSDIYPWW